MLDVNPVEGMTTFTIEALFKPDADGAPERIRAAFRLDINENDNDLTRWLSLDNLEIWQSDTAELDQDNVFVSAGAAADQTSYGASTIGFTSGTACALSRDEGPFWALPSRLQPLQTGAEMTWRGKKRTVTERNQYTPDKLPVALLPTRALFQLTGQRPGSLRLPAR